MKDHMKGTRRERFGPKAVFLFAAIGGVAGFINAWQFPFLMYRYGGLAFLIPYLIVILLVGAPLFMLECAIGQRYRRGIVESMEDVSGAFSGTGVMSVSYGGIILVYYAVLVAIATLFLGNAFFLPAASPAESGDTARTLYTTLTGLGASITAEGGVNTRMLLALFITWAAIALASSFGAHSLRFVYTALVPLTLTLLLVFAFLSVSQDGADFGVALLFTPDLAKTFADEGVWRSAFAHVGIMLLLGTGVLPAFGSYNKNKYDLVQGAYITILVAVAVSVIAGVAASGFLGRRANAMATEGVPFHMVVAEETRKSLDVFPELSTYVKGVRKTNYTRAELIAGGVLSKEEAKTRALPEAEPIHYTRVVAIERALRVNVIPELRYHVAPPPPYDYRRLSLKGIFIKTNDVARAHFSTLIGEGSFFAFATMTETILADTDTQAQGGTWTYRIFLITLFLLGFTTAIAYFEGVATSVMDVLRKHAIFTFPRPLIRGALALLFFAAGVIFTTPRGLYFADAIDHYVTRYGVFLALLMEVIAFGWFYDTFDMRRYLNATGTLRLGPWWEIAIRYAVPLLAVYHIAASIIEDVASPYGGYPPFAHFLGILLIAIPLAVGIVRSIIYLVHEDDAYTF